MSLLQVTNPHCIDTSRPFIYLVEVRDGHGRSYRYVGRARSGRRLQEYVRNIARILRGLPRGEAQGYRAVHLALAKACEGGWLYAIYPIESVTKESANTRERELIQQHQCNLNDGKTWAITDFHALSIDMLVARVGATPRSHPHLPAEPSEK